MFSFGVKNNCNEESYNTQYFESLVNQSVNLQLEDLVYDCAPSVRSSLSWNEVSDVLPTPPRSEDEDIKQDFTILNTFEEAVHLPTVNGYSESSYHTNEICKKLHTSSITDEDLMNIAYGDLFNGSMASTELRSVIEVEGNPQDYFYGSGSSQQFSNLTVVDYTDAPIVKTAESSSSPIIVDDDSVSSISSNDVTAAADTSFTSKQSSSKRTTFTEQQKKVLMEEFHNNSPYLSRSRKKQLAQQLNISENRLRVWFQNRRVKLKKNKQKESISRNDTALVPHTPPSGNEYGYLHPQTSLYIKQEIDEEASTSTQASNFNTVEDGSTPLVGYTGPGRSAGNPLDVDVHPTTALTVRKRTEFSAYQRNALMEEFNRNLGYLSRDRTRELAKRLGLTDNQVKVWFQNRRVKLKKNTNKEEVLDINTSIQRMEPRNTYQYYPPIPLQAQNNDVSRMMTFSPSFHYYRYFPL